MRLDTAVAAMIRTGEILWSPQRRVQWRGHGGFAWSAVADWWSVSDRASSCPLSPAVRGVG